ncbi:autotransporter domain-containing protein [Litorimonas sp. RW-G-Af-16]|uniref:autotransporter family protein n=1 Tax=Litorimonas sp. RW-G-Af-16 TaxID=3241168 RepID=UPI00390CCA7B
MRKTSTPISAKMTAARLLSSAAILALGTAISLPAFAQVTVTDGRTTPVQTSTAGDGDTPSDVTIESGGSVTLTTPGPAVILDSDNALDLSGAVVIADVDNATGVSLQGGADRSYTQSGSISITENFTNTNTDDDVFPDGPFAQGTGRTGILISGASPFIGNVETTSTSAITVEGNDSFGINLANTPMMVGGLTGSMTTEGAISVTGDNSYGVNVASNVSGDLNNTGNIQVAGIGSTGYNVSGDVQGGFVNSGAVAVNGYRFSTRPGLSTQGAGRDDLGAEDLGQAGSAIAISGNVDGGVYLQRRLIPAVDADGAPVLDDDGNELFTLASTSTVTQFGSAPAILLDGDGTIMSIGLVAAITDPADADFDEDMQYAFINEGQVAASGIYDDFDATALLVEDATLAEGLSNQGTMRSTTFRSPTELADMRGTGLARVIVLGDQAIANTIDNQGIILATASEATDAVYADSDNPLAPRDVTAIAIDIGANATTQSLTNSGSLSALIVARQGRAVAIQDASGTLTSITNTGNIIAAGSNSDGTLEAETDFELIAIDVSQNTTGFTLTQSQTPDDDPDDDISPIEPRISGSVLMGSGDDSLIASAGAISGQTVAFGAGNDTLALSGGASLNANVTNSGGLDISVIEGSSLVLRSGDPLSITSANFDGTSSFSPVIDGSAGTASTLISSGDITFESGATIAPILNNVSFVPGNSQVFDIASAGGTLTVGDIAALSAGETPFLYNTGLSLNAAGDLVITLDLRDPNVSVEQGGLGLDQVQGQAFNAALQSLTSNNGLGNAFANITNSNDFYAAYNQILPEFAAAARQFVVANVDGATGAVGSHLDTARRSPDKPGGAWLQEFAYFADRELAGLSEQYRGAGFGFTGGLDTALGPLHTVGVNFGFASTEIEDVVGIDEPLDVITLQGGLYAGWQSGGLSVDVYGGGGYNKFEQQRRVRINEFFGETKGDWAGYHINGSVRAGYDVELSEKFWLRPTVSLDYLSLTENAYEETGVAGLAVGVDKRKSDLGSATAMINLGAKFQGKRTWIRPSIRFGYRNDFISDPVMTTYRYVGLNDGNGGLFDSQRAELESIMFPDSGVLVGFSVAAGSAYSSIGFDFDSDIRDGFIRHTGRVVVRLLF